MPEIGDGIVRIVTISSNSSVEFTADAGEKWKVTMTYAKSSSNGGPVNGGFYVSPTVGNESGRTDGTGTPDNDHPPLGTFAGGSQKLQPQYIDDTNGLFFGNNIGISIDVIVNAIRVA